MKLIRRWSNSKITDAVRPFNFAQAVLQCFDSRELKLMLSTTSRQFEIDYQAEHVSLIPNQALQAMCGRLMELRPTTEIDFR